MKLLSLLKSSPPYLWLFPPQPLFRDRKPPSEKPERSPVSPVGVLAGGMMLASLVVTTSAVLRGPVSASTTDGYAAAGRDAEHGEDMTVNPVIAVIDRNCAEHAREKLMVGLTNYYLQRRLRPGATSDDAAETSSLTGVLAGPGDPAAMTPATSCQS
jgi:hypothetical protein